MTKKKHTSNSTDNATVEIKNYPTSLIHDHTSEDGSVFHSLSFRWKDAWASLILPAGSTSQSVMRNGIPIEGRLNIKLGDPEQIQNVSVLQDDSTYQQTPMFNRTILSAIMANKKRILAANRSIEWKLSHDYHWPSLPGQILHLFRLT